MIKIVITTTDNDKTKNEIIFNLLEKKLAACIQVKEIYSFYLWEGNVEKAKEVLILIKTLPELVEKVKEEIKKAHNYKIPEILVLEGEVNEDYLNWMKKVTQ
ncbi:MAG TPA: divalent-cation tolerance protein CutA [Nautiliaceae bacterium]|nr:divalent-cation tolerance protein CutA [Nautiliaceae bacterium]